MLTVLRTLLFLTFACLISLECIAKPLTIRIGLISQTRPFVKVYNSDEQAVDLGVSGAQLAIADVETTGKFLENHYEFEQTKVNSIDESTQALRNFVAKGYSFVLLDVDASTFKKLLTLPESQSIGLINVSLQDDDLRKSICKKNIFHTSLSRAMQADAIAQYLLKKRWTNILLVVGTDPNDAAYAAAVERAAKRYGLKIVKRLDWPYGAADNSRTAEKEVPVLTQAYDYQILMVADEANNFGDTLIFHTWTPVLIAGTQGLSAVSWHLTQEKWGAVQLQNRFKARFKRWMEPLDYQAWLGVQAVATAVTRVQSSDAAQLISYMRGEDYRVAAYKGVGLSFKPENGQLRQPVILATPRTLVSISPQPGILHQGSELDTLGLDSNEITCQ